MASAATPPTATSHLACCSGSGAFRRTSSQKWRLKQSMVKSLHSRDVRGSLNRDSSCNCTNFSMEAASSNQLARLSLRHGLASPKQAHLICASRIMIHPTLLGTLRPLSQLQLGGPAQCCNYLAMLKQLEECIRLKHLESTRAIGTIGLVRTEIIVFKHTHPWSLSITAQNYCPAMPLKHWLPTASFWDSLTAAHSTFGG